MPRRDKTGPDGNGAGTGRGIGSCTENKDLGTPNLGRRGGGRRSSCWRGCIWYQNNNGATTQN